MKIRNKKNETNDKRDKNNKKKSYLQFDVIVSLSPKEK